MSACCILDNARHFTKKHANLWAQFCNCEGKQALNRREFQALDAIYDTIVNPGSWRKALDTTADALEARAIALVIRGRRAGAKDLTMMSSIYLDFSRTSAGWYYAAFLSRLQNQDWELLKRQPIHQPTLDTASGLTATDLDARRDYAFLGKRTGVARRLGIRLNADDVWFDAMSIGFDRAQTNVPVAATRDVKILLPHLTKALEVGRMFAFLKARYRAMLSALDKVQAGLAIALPDGQLVVKNTEAERILDEKDGLAEGSDGKLAVEANDLGSAISARIRDAAETATGKANRAESLFAVPRLSGKSAYLIDISPISERQNADAELDRGLNGALVTIVDPERAPYLRVERLAKLYGLTNAETDVCRWIAEGASIAQIAERRGTSPTTAKNQVAAILSKTGVDSRTSLIRLVLRVLPPVI